MKDYKRLTKRNYFDGDYSVVPEELSKEITNWKEQHATEMTAPPVWYHLGERLCQLETKIENGTLIELPCKVGDTVYTIDLNNCGERVISEVKIAEIVIFGNGVYYNDNTGVWLFEVFKTKAEAEARLREIQGAER